MKDDNVSNNNVSIFGMPKENDWILNSLALDETGLRDYFSYNTANQMGEYASRTMFCEVIVNGDYRGLYIFMEKIKVDSGRLNILKMDETCINSPEVTGGYFPLPLFNRHASFLRRTYFAVTITFLGKIFHFQG